VASKMLDRIKGKLILLGGLGGTIIADTAVSQVAEKGIVPAANTYRAYQDGSINRNSGNYQPLNLLNDFYPSIEIRIEDHDNVRRRSDFEPTLVGISSTRRIMAPLPFIKILIKKMLSLMFSMPGWV